MLTETEISTTNVNSSENINNTSSPVLKEETTILESRSETTITNNLDILHNKMKENNEKFNSLLERIKTETVNNKPSIQEISAVKNEEPTSFIASNTSETISKIVYLPEGMESELQHNAEEAADIARVVQKIKVGAEAMGERTVNLLKEREIELQESQQATERQIALYNRVAEFVQNVGPSRAALYIGFLGVGSYTLYNIFRYGQIPFGGFLRNLISPNNPLTPIEPVTSPISSNINIKIEYPNLPTLPTNTPLTPPTPPTTSGTLDVILTNNSPWLLGGIIVGMVLMQLIRK